MQPFRAIDFSNSSSVVAAVSGGSDSLALLTLLHDHFSDRASPALLAVTVDHGLRPESGDEARKVGAICAGLGVDHRIVRWEAPAGGAGLQARARAARYRLLAGVARDAGAAMILTGHTLDDQLETVTMRATRGEGPGLAGIAPATFARDRDHADGGIWFMRPLLDTGRDALRDHLRCLGLGWIDDPSNADRHFERVRMRDTLAAMTPDERAALVRRQTEAAAARLALDADAARLIDTHVSEAAPGLMRLDARLVETADDAVLRACGIVLAFTGGVAALPPHEKLRGWAGQLAKKAGRATLTRCVAERRGDAVWMRRENRDVTAGAGGRVFDGRYAICGGDHAGRLVAQGDDDAPPEASLGVPRAPAARAARLQPVLEAGGGVQFVWRPAPDMPVRRIFNPWPDMVPLFDLRSACALARLAGAPAVLPPPMKSVGTAS